MGMRDATEIAPNNWYNHANGEVVVDMSRAIDNVEPMTIDGIQLFPKEEYHATLISVRDEFPDPKKEARFIHHLRDFLWEYRVEPSILGPERYLCQKGDEATVVARAHLFGEITLRKYVRRHIPDYDPFYYVTLLANDQSEQEIPISSVAELAERCRQL